MQKNITLFRFHAHALQKISMFSIHEHCEITCKNDLYSCEYHEKIKFPIHAKFRVKKNLIILNKCTILF